MLGQLVGRTAKNSDLAAVQLLCARGRTTMGLVIQKAAFAVNGAVRSNAPRVPNNWDLIQIGRAVNRHPGDWWVQHGGGTPSR